MSGNLPAELQVWKTEFLTSEHLTSHLTSGRPEIDSWLDGHALRLQEEGSCRTYVWADQHPYVSAFYTLAPHRIDAVENVQLPGHAGGQLSGYLIWKIGMHPGAAEELSNIPGGRDGQLPNKYLLLIDAVVQATRASYAAGGRFIFVDLNNEPQFLVDAVRAIGFRPITPNGTMCAMLLRRPTVGA